MRLLFWGMNGVYTWTVLEALIDADLPVVAVILDGKSVSGPATGYAFTRHDPPSSELGELSLLTARDAYVTQNTVNTAWRADIPVYAVHDLVDRSTLDLLATFQADVACVACFPIRLPASLLSLPTHGFLNVHPSLLPNYRGPFPLFWQLRDGVERVGVTVHWMDARLDSGDIAGQGNVSLPEGIDGRGADRLLAATGGQQLVDLLQALERGETVRRPQPSGGSYQPPPTVADFKLDRSWSALHAYCFMRGTAEWGHPFELMLGEGELLRLKSAVDYLPTAQLSVPYRRRGSELLIQFAQGVLVATAA